MLFVTLVGGLLEVSLSGVHSMSITLTQSQLRLQYVNVRTLDGVPVAVLVYVLCLRVPGASDLSQVRKHSPSLACLTYHMVGVDCEVLRWSAAHSRRPVCLITAISGEVNGGLRARFRSPYSATFHGLIEPVVNAHTLSRSPIISRKVAIAPFTS